MLCSRRVQRLDKQTDRLVLSTLDALDRPRDSQVRARALYVRFFKKDGADVLFLQLQMHLPAAEMSELVAHPEESDFSKSFLENLFCPMDTWGKTLCIRSDWDGIWCFVKDKHVHSAFGDLAFPLSAVGAHVAEVVLSLVAWADDEIETR